jgi:hypothetical protein
MDYIEVKATPKKRVNWITIVPLSLVIFFFSFQLYVLTNVGDKGEKITQLKRQQAELKIDNEIMRAKIMELQTNQAVIGPLNEKVKVERKNINVIDIGYSGNLTAMR